MRYVTVGNGAAGATAAQTIRQNDAAGEIIILTAEPYPMYSRPGLAYVLINEVPAEQIMARTLDWYEEWGINLVRGEAVKLDVPRQMVWLADRTVPHLRPSAGRHRCPRHTAPLSRRGVGRRGLPGHARRYEGTGEETRRARRAVVIGGGITALELTEGLAHRGIDTHYFLRRDRLWGQVFNDEEAALLEKKMKAHHVHIHYHTEAVEVLGDRKGRVRAVRLKGGSEFKCDLVGVAIGVKPFIDVVAHSPIVTDRAILVNERMETNVPNVYAAGDCAQVYDRWTEKHMLDILWPSAVAEGNAAGLNMAGKPYEYQKGSPFNACLLFGLHITTMGQINPRRDETTDEPQILQHVSRGSSEVWYTYPRPYRSAWAAENENTIRLVLSGDYLVGALVIGEQSLTDSLRYLIENQANIGSMVGRNSVQAALACVAA